MRTGRLAGAGSLALLLFAARDASAQVQGVAIDRFDPSERGSDWFALESLDLRGDPRPAAGTVLGYAYRPLAIYDAAGTLRTAVVRDSLVLHSGASLVLWDRVRFGLDLPVYLFQDGQTGTLGGATFTPPSESIGDLRLGADVRLLGRYADLLTVAAGAQLFVPTGSPADYTSDGVVRLMPRVLAAGRAADLEYAAKVAFDYRPLGGTLGGIGLGSDLVYAVAAGFRTSPGPLLGVELLGSTTVTGSAQPLARGDTPLELLFGVHADLGRDWRLGVGAGPGLTRAFGEPTFRALVSLDLVPAAEAARAPEPPRPVAPPPSPPPLAPPPAPPPAAPVEPAPPSLVQIEGDRLVLAQPIDFQTGSAEIEPASNPILVEIATQLLAHPELRRVRIEGHTDDVGSPAFNYQLSDRRARAVLQWLVANGIDRARLESRGYGASRPVGDNATEEGRRHNRRVELHILERRAPGAPK